MATNLYLLARDGFLESTAGFAWTAASIQLAFVTSGYAPDFTTDQYFEAAVPGGDVVAQSGNFASLSSLLGTANAANETVSSVTGAAFTQLIILSYISGVSPLILYTNSYSGLPCTPNGGNIVVNWDTGANKIFTLCHEYVGRGAWSTIRDGVRMLFDRTYTGRVWAGHAEVVKMEPTYEQACAQAAYLERVAKAKEIEKRFGGRIPILG